MRDFDKYSMVGSIARADLSVRTPSLVGSHVPTLTQHSGASYVHQSNPNPQKGKSKFKSIRETGYLTPSASQAAKVAGLSVIHTPYFDQKFGKRVFMGNYQMSDKEVFDLHMQQIKMKGSLQNFDRHIKLLEEQQFSKFVSDQLKKDHMRQEMIQKLMKEDFLSTNHQRQEKNSEKKRQEYQQKLQEKYEHFPYKGSDEVENHRKQLKEMQKKEFLQYLSHRQGMTTNNFSNSETSSTFSPLTDNLSGALSQRIPIEAAKFVDTGKIKMLNCVQKDHNATNSNKITVKTLFDHGSNDRNKLLIYDDDPRIAVVMEQAQYRHD